MCGRCGNYRPSSPSNRGSTTDEHGWTRMRRVDARGCQAPAGEVEHSGVHPGSSVFIRGSNLSTAESRFNLLVPRCFPRTDRLATTGLGVSLTPALTPALSPGEREPRTDGSGSGGWFPRTSQFPNVDAGRTQFRESFARNPARRMVLPLPGGEGRGEGGRGVLTFLTTTRASHSNRRGILIFSKAFFAMQHGYKS